MEKRICAKGVKNLSTEKARQKRFGAGGEAAAEEKGALPATKEEQLLPEEKKEDRLTQKGGKVE